MMDVRCKIGEYETPLAAGQCGLIERQPAVELDGQSSSEINPRGQPLQSSAGRRQTAPAILPPHCGGIAMDKVITCPCGFAFVGSSDDEAVKEAQEHAKSVHAMELSREQALQMARPA